MLHEDEPEPNEPEEIRRQNDRRLRRTTERACRQSTRAAILGVLAEDQWAELTKEEIHNLLSSKVPPKRRGNLYHIRYHLEVLCKSGLVGKMDDDPPRYTLL